MAATVAMALVQKRGGTPKIDVAPKQRQERCAMGAESTHHEGQSLNNYYWDEGWWGRGTGRLPW